MLLGELLVAQGFVTVADTEAASARQKNYGGRIGENFIALGLITKATLEAILRKQYELASAVLNYENLLAKAQQIHGTDHPKTNRQRFYLAQALIAAGNPAEALNLAQAALAGHEAALGGEHSWTRASAQVVADALAALNRTALSDEPADVLSPSI
jgi:Tetratricopeptide repeat